MNDCLNDFSALTAEFREMQTSMEIKDFRVCDSFIDSDYINKDATKPGRP